MGTFSPIVPRPHASLARAWASLLPTVLLALAVLATLFSAVAFGQALQPLPAIRSPVTDTTGTLTAEQVRALEDELRAFEQRKGSQVIVVLVPTTLPEPIEQYSIRLAEQVKAGRKKVDDGVIVLVVIGDRKSRIEVGYGLEGAIPDLAASQIRREVMNPYFRNGDYYGGIRATVQALMKRIEGEALPPAWNPEGRAGVAQSPDWETWIFPAVIVVLVLGGILKAVFGRFIGSTLVGGVVGTGAALVTQAIPIAIGVGIIAFIFSLVLAGRGLPTGRHGPWTGGWGGGGWSGGGHSGGGWSGGGGGFGGGGASGSWDD